MQFVHSWRKHSQRKSDDAHKKIGFVKFNKAATKRDCSGNSGHTSGATIQPELMNHVLIPYSWKEFIFHRDSVYNQVSITKSGLVAGGKEIKKEGKLFSSRLLIHSEAMHTKRKDQVKFTRDQEKSIITVIGETIKTTCTGSQGRWGPQSGTRTGGGGPARVPNLRVQTPQRRGWHTQGEKGALTSCRGTLLVSTSNETHGGKTGLPARVSGRHVVREATAPTCPCPNSCRFGRP